MRTSRLTRMLDDRSRAVIVYRLLYWKVVHPLRERLFVRMRTLRYPGAARLLETVRPYTMVGVPRLINALELTHRVEREGTRGAIVECGVFKGGCAGIMAKVSAEAGCSRKVWLFDSFEGLPEPTANDGAKAVEYAAERAGGRLTPIGRCVGPLEDVERLLFALLRVPRAMVVIRKGWFQDTLPVARKEIGEIALLRLDGDWYESTKECLENLYDNVVVGGFVIIDDYGYWDGCRRATDEFLAERGIKARLEHVDDSGVFFRKP